MSVDLGRRHALVLGEIVDVLTLACSDFAVQVSIVDVVPVAVGFGDAAVDPIELVPQGIDCIRLQSLASPDLPSAQQDPTRLHALLARSGLLAGTDPGATRRGSSGDGGGRGGRRRGRRGRAIASRGRAGGEDIVGVVVEAKRVCRRALAHHRGLNLLGLGGLFDGGDIILNVD